MYVHMLIITDNFAVRRCNGIAVARLFSPGERKKKQNPHFYLVHCVRILIYLWYLDKSTFMSVDSTVCCETTEKC